MQKVIRSRLVLSSLISTAVFLVGCTTTDLQRTNQRLTEANNRLVSENNRLEQELARAERDLSVRTRELAGLEDHVDQIGRKSDTPAGGFEQLGLESESTLEGTVVRLDAAVFFPLGKAALSSEGRKILARVARLLQGEYGNRVIRVEGHTDDLPVRKVRHLYPSNWELSTARACSVVRHLVQSGSINPHRIYAAGYSHYRPRVDGSSASARRKNRRVEILILDDNHLGK